MNDIDENFIEIIKQFCNYKSIICLNGKLPSTNLINRLKLPIIATDGAYDKLRKIGVTADVVIGDLDSICSEIEKNVKCIKIYDQDYSDFEKALNYAEENSIMPAIIFGINGGFIDHILHNIEIFSKTECIGYDFPNVIFSLKKNKVLKFPKQTKISLFGGPSCCISSCGLQWELDNTVLNFPEYSSCFNRTKSDVIEIMVRNGCALIVVYLQKIVDAGIQESCV